MFKKKLIIYKNFIQLKIIKKKREEKICKKSILEFVLTLQVLLHIQQFYFLNV